jgi:hypothetical protein
LRHRAATSDAARAPATSATCTPSVATKNDTRTSERAVIGAVGRLRVAASKRPPTTAAPETASTIGVRPIAAVADCALRCPRDHRADRTHARPVPRRWKRRDRRRGGDRVLEVLVDLLEHAGADSAREMQPTIELYEKASITRVSPPRPWRPLRRSRPSPCAARPAWPTRLMARVRTERRRVPCSP